MTTSNSFGIEKIVGHKFYKNKKRFLIRFSGLTADEDCWFPEEQIPDKEMISKYLENAPNIPNYKINDYSYATNDILTLDQLRYKDPNMIIGVYKSDDKLFYRVEFKNNRFYSVESSILKEVFPHLVCEYLEQNIIIKTKKKEEK